MQTNVINQLVGKLAEDSSMYEPDEPGTAQDQAKEIMFSFLQKFPRYCETVCSMHNEIKMIQFSFSSPEVTRERIESVDLRRHNAHEAAIASMKAINRMRTYYHVPQFAEIDTDDRYQVADFTAKFCAEMYNMPEVRSMDEFAAEHPYFRADSFQSIFDGIIEPDINPNELQESQPEEQNNKLECHETKNSEWEIGD